MTVMNEALIKKDRLRFTKNKLSANLTLLAIVINALYFVNIYKSDVGTYYYKLIIGVSVVYNLLFMLTAFLSFEGVKNYKIGYAFVLLVLGVGQIVRIFILPAQAKNAVVTLSGEEQAVMDGAQFMWLCIFLTASAALCFAAGVIGIIKTGTLKNYQAELEKEAKGSRA